MPTPVDEVKAAHRERLMALPGVVSVGIGRDASGRPVIVVGVRDEPPPDLPTVLEGHPVEVRRVGPVRAE